MVTGTTPATSPDDQGNPRDPPGLATIGILSRGFGYLQPPNAVISPTAKVKKGPIRPAEGRAINRYHYGYFIGDDLFDLMLMELIPSNGSWLHTPRTSITCRWHPV